jgi:hypothetical protein
MSLSPETANVNAPPRPFTPDAEQFVRLCRKYFLNRTDTLAFLPSWSKQACRAVVGDDLDNLLVAHLRGGGGTIRWGSKGNQGGEDRPPRVRLGTYGPSVDGLVLHACVDFDGGGRHAAPLKDPLGAALAFVERCASVGLVVYLEQSGGGAGWHVWVFFAGRVSAAVVRRVLFALMPDGVKMKDGSDADARNGKGIEVFPKQDAIDPDGFGNMVWLPFWGGAAGAASLFHRVNDGGEIEPYLPSDFDTNDAALVEELADLLDRQPAGNGTGSVFNQRVTGGGRVSTDLLLRRALERVRPGTKLGRNGTGFWLACQLRDNKYTRGESQPVVLEFARSVSQDGHDYTESEALASLTSAFNGKAREPWSDRAEGKSAGTSEGNGAPGDDDDLPDIIDIGELWDTYPEMREPVIQDLLRRGETMNVVSTTKVGKSWMIVGLALSMATGKYWLGKFLAGPGRVLVIDNELHPETLSARLRAVAKALGMSREDLQGKVAVWHLRGRLKNIQQIRRLLRKAEYPPQFFSLIIIDAEYRTYPEGMGENDNAQMAGFYNTLDAMAAENDCALALVHHATKGNQSEKGVTDVGAGAGSLSRAADTHLIVREHEKEGVAVLQVALRSFPPVEPVCLKWDWPLWTPEEGLNPQHLKRAGNARQEAQDADSDDTVLKAVEELDTDGRGVSICSVSSRTSFKVPRIEAAVTRLAQRGQVARVTVSRRTRKGEPMVDAEGNPVMARGVKRVRNAWEAV